MINISRDTRVGKVCELDIFSFEGRQCYFVVKLSLHRNIVTVFKMKTHSLYLIVVVYPTEVDTSF